MLNDTTLSVHLKLKYKSRISLKIILPYVYFKVNGLLYSNAPNLLIQLKKEMTLRSDMINNLKHNTFMP